MAKPKTITRNFKKNNSVMHDLYKLQVAPMMKNMAMDAEDGVEVSPEFIKLEHCHIYHTVDSKGQPQTQCSPIGGHFHIIEVVTPGDGENPPVLKCSGPKKYVRDRITKKKRIVPYEKDYADHNGRTFTDDHTHEITYVSSEEFKPRQINMEATKFVAHIQSKEPAPVPGIV